MMTQMLERAGAIRGRFPLGLIWVGERAYRALGAEGCLDLLQRYADGPRTDDDSLACVAAPGRAHSYEVGGAQYIASTEPHGKDGYEWVTTLCIAEDL